MAGELILPNKKLMIPENDLITLPTAELIELCAVDSELYCTTFFPRTVRSPFAPFHHDMWKKMESNNRLINHLVFRGGAKTTHSRLFTSKQIAYQISRTILYVSKSEGHAIRSTNWIKKAVEHNKLWGETYMIEKGAKWQDTEFEILVGGQSIWIIAAGIEGSIRGLNRDDYRPDLIVLDDVLDDENAHTEERRQKISTLVYGALVQSLAPRSEAPQAKLVALNTPQHKEDFAVAATKDPTWISSVYGCWSKETADLTDEYKESAWPDRYPADDLRKDKRGYIMRNVLSNWLREMECKLASPETVAFQVGWLKKYATLPEKATYTYAIDPVPPPSDIAVKKGALKTDFEAHVVWGAIGDKRFLAHYELMRGHEPTWSAMKFFEIQQKFRPVRTMVEATGYQQVLVWLLRQAMNQNKRWYSITEFKSQRSKYVRIVNAFNGIASNGLVYVRADQVDFIEQFTQYPDVANDDLLDASAVALMALEQIMQGVEDEDDPEFGGTGTKFRPLNICAAP